jgi:hypothetical protein
MQAFTAAVIDHVEEVPGQKGELTKLLVTLRDGLRCCTFCLFCLSICLRIRISFGLSRSAACVFAWDKTAPIVHRVATRGEEPYRSHAILVVLWVIICDYSLLQCFRVELNEKFGPGKVPDFIQPAWLDAAKEESVRTERAAQRRAGKKQPPPASQPVSLLPSSARALSPVLVGPSAAVLPAVPLPAASSQAVPPSASIAAPSQMQPLPSDANSNIAAGNSQPLPPPPLPASDIVHVPSSVAPKRKRRPGSAIKDSGAKSASAPELGLGDLSDKDNNTHTSKRRRSVSKDAEPNADVNAEAETQAPQFAANVDGTA